MSKPQRSFCTFMVGTHEREPWTGHPIPCGGPAAGPHPDPEKGYREPLCARHRAEVEREMQEPEADEALLIEVLDMAMEARYG